MSPNIDPQEDAILEGDQDLDLEEADEPKVDDEPKDDDQPKDKPKLTPEQQIAIFERKANSLRKKHGITVEPKADPKKEAPKSGDLDYGQKAYLVASGIKGEEERKLVTEFMENTGKSLEDVVENKFFQAELKELREGKASADAVPKGSKRTGQSSKDSVDYWLAKGEMPENTPENQELRRKIVNERYKRETSTNKFASNMTGNVTRQSQLRK